MAAAGFEDGAGRGAVESPHFRGWQVAVKLLVNLLHGYSIERKAFLLVVGIWFEAGTFQDFRKRQGIDVWLQCIGIERGGWGCDSACYCCFFQR